MKNFLILLVCSLAIFSSVSAQASQTIPYSPSVNVPTPVLGDGYSNDNQQTTQVQCLNLSAPSYSGQNIGLVDFDKQYNFDQLKQQLNIDVSGHVGIGAFSGSAGAQFMHYLENDDLSETLIYRTNYTFKTQGAAPKPIFDSYLNLTGKKEWAAGPAQFRQACGDTYISQMHSGAYLYIVYQLHFLSTTDKQTFDAQFSASYASLAKLSASMQQSLDKLHIQGNIHIMAYQVGGAPTQLGTIFKSGPFPWSPSPISQCSFSDLNACNEVISGIMDYVSNPTNGFPSQLKITAGQPVPSLAADASFETVPYTSLDPKLQTQSVLTDTIVAARDKLGSILDATNAHLQRAEYLQQQVNFPYIYDDYKTKLDNYIDSLNTNINTLQEGGQSCFNNATTCLSVETQTLNNLQPDDPSILAIPQSLFIDEVDASSQPVSLALAMAPGSPTSGQEQFLGTQIKPTMTGEYDSIVYIDGPTIYITLRDHATQDDIANYQGEYAGNNKYTGTVTYLPSKITGTWTGTFSSSEAPTNVK